MRRLYFIRHGLSVNNVEGKLSGTTDTPLTDIGREQARLAGNAAKKLSIDTIVTSPLSRATETANIIAGQISFPYDKIIVNKLFIERNFGPYEGKPYGTTRLADVPEVESVEEIIDRAKKSLEYLRKLEAENVLIVSHGAFGRALRHITLNLEYDHPEQFQNGKIVRLI